MTVLMDPEVGAEALTPAPGTPALYLAIVKGGRGTAERRSVHHLATLKGGPTTGSRRPVRHPATAKNGPGVGSRTRMPVLLPATAKTGPGVGSRRSPRHSVTPQAAIHIKGGIRIGDRSHGTSPVDPNKH